MYHYVRDLVRSRFPRIKARTVEEFENQIHHLRKDYSLITMEELIEAASSPKIQLPERAALLTFDDGYIDHFSNVFPILNQERIQGSFFIPACVVREDRVLDVNKIHFVLASVSDPRPMVVFITETVDRYRTQYHLQPSRYYLDQYARAGRYDPAEVVFIKRMLQKVLPSPLRKQLVDELFKTHVTDSETSFARELYMTSDQIQCMARNGMFIGSHGYSHEWMDTMDEKQQEMEIEQSLHFLRQVRRQGNQWVMCYPYGAWNDTLLSILRTQRCSIGLTAQVAVADLDKENPLKLSRLDTNDLPA